MSTYRTSRILRVSWHNGDTEYYGSLTALYAKNTAEQVGVSYNSLKQYMSRNKGTHVTKFASISYVPVYIAVRPARKGIARTE